MGSVPVIEDVMTPGRCSPGHPLRLLKEWDAPVIYLKSWDELSDILQKEALMNDSEKLARRRNLINWYNWFKQKMREKFVSLVEQYFFD